MARVSFYLDGEVVEIDVEQGATLLEAASRTGVYLNSLCGGEGICGTCKVLVKDGQIGHGSTGLLTKEEAKEGYVLACQTKVLGDVKVEVPLETRIEEGQILIDKDAEKLHTIRAGGEEV
ncbi:2Fe-2S iron-sulfur cluster binding domain-containing protein, partial [Candidatus Bipolaricaulota bacterium]|nr:2Fe-2S iron-sulfur cluster binding domain-containing protein [Candidatus Bipolaricaulota bacterium]